MRKEMKKVDLTLMVNEDCDNTGRKVMNGALSIDPTSRSATFVESALRKEKRRNTKVWDGCLLSMIIKPNGNFQVHTKNVNPLLVENFAMKMYLEACEVLNKAMGKDSE